MSGRDRGAEPRPVLGVDTNILLRHTLADDESQSPAASRLLMGVDSAEGPLVVNPVVLIEFIWTLQRRERFGKADILDPLDALADASSIVLLDEDAVMSAIEGWRRGRADFQDCLIAALNLQAGASSTLTFDATAAREPGFSLLPS